mmetsp:Transcript_10534/g.20015  ORF Transcript_10534/g.20015 Transcript_10534/m.20015 type:complete len:99 (+) Transcript_10534:216-512(+)
MPENPRNVASTSVDIKGGTSPPKPSAASREHTLSVSRERLKESRKLAHEAEDIGASILGQLQSQHQTIQRSQQAQRETSENISQSEKLLKRMGTWFKW